MHKVALTDSQKTEVLTHQSLLPDSNPHLLLVNFLKNFKFN